MDEAAVLATYALETLSGANLDGADLSWANLAGANLSSACLSKADLSGVKLPGANLCGANLRGADLFRANLHEANLSGADLRGANLSFANLSGANLSGADLYKSYLPEANLSGANLLGVQGLASMKEEMETLILLREQIRQESFEFDMEHSHGGESPDKSSFESFLNTCGTTHCASGFCQVKLAKEGNPIALTSASIVVGYAIPSMAWLFSSSNDKFIEHLDKLISGEEPLLQR